MFFNIKGSWYHRNSIAAVKILDKPNIGKDNISRDVIVVLNDYVAREGYREIWCTREECAKLLAYLEEKYV